MTNETLVQIRSDVDIVAAREKARELAVELGFSKTDQTMIATAISELARNIVLYARVGAVVLGYTERNGKTGLIVVARDNGPGIKDPKLAQKEGYSTSGGLGLGLPGVKRLMDDFELVSEIGKGTKVTVTKWQR